jgi:antitoxin HigA-1
VLPPVHPGEHLREDFMAPLRLSAYRLAQDICVPTTRIQAIITGRRGITGDTALRLGRYFGTTPEFWMNLQRDYELEKAEIEHGIQIEVQVRARAG